MFHKQKDQFEQNYTSGLYLDINIFHLWNITFTLQSVIFEPRFERSESIRQTLFLRQYIDGLLLHLKFLSFPNVYTKSYYGEQILQTLAQTFILSNKGLRDPL